MRDAIYTQVERNGKKYDSWRSQTFPATRKGKSYELYYYQAKATAPNTYWAGKAIQEKGETDGSNWPGAILSYSVK